MPIPTSQYPDPADKLAPLGAALDSGISVAMTN
jgi:hypothetical protein